MSKRYGFVIDQERCIGCEACTIACGIEHESEGYISVMQEGRDQEESYEGESLGSMVWTPKLCHHCENPPCIEACSVGALKKREDGIVIVDDELCNGCRECENVCPYDAVYFKEDDKTVEKCNLCAHRIDRGKEPFCVICCEGQAIYFGDLNDPNSKVSQLVSEGEIFKLKPKLETEPSVYYLPPKPKKKL